MGTSKLQIRQDLPSRDMGRYAVYFSHGSRFEVIANSELEAEAIAKARNFESGSYCTRAVKLAYEEIKEPKDRRTEMIRNILFPLYRNVK